MAVATSSRYYKSLMEIAGENAGVTADLFRLANLFRRNVCASRLFSKRICSGCSASIKNSVQSIGDDNMGSSYVLFSPALRAI